MYDQYKYPSRREITTHIAIRKPALFSRVRTPKHTHLNVKILIASSFAAASAQKFAFRAAPAKTVANKKIAQRSSRRVASLRVEAAKKSVGDLAKGDLEGNKQQQQQRVFILLFLAEDIECRSIFGKGAGARRRGRPRRSCAQMHRSRVYPMPLLLL